MLILFGGGDAGHPGRGVRAARPPVPVASDHGSGRPGRGHDHDHREGRRPGGTPRARSAIDGPALFLQGALVALGLVALLLVAERSLEPGGAFVATAAVTVGTRPTASQSMRRGSGTRCTRCCCSPSAA